MEHKILLIDDEPNILAALKRVLIEEPYEVLTAESAEKALEIMGENRCKVVISDERMPGMGGAEFLCRVNEMYPETVRILLTGHASIEAAMKAVNSGEIYRFFMKPWNDLDLRMAIRSALEKYDLEEENRQLLALVRKQANDLKSIEERYPGITRVEKDTDGSICLPEISDEEMVELVKEWNEDPTGNVEET
jgi:two-component system, probable response regulator PhcQ